MVVERGSSGKHKRKERGKESMEQKKNMKILKRYTKKRRVRQRRQLRWQRDVRMMICMLDWKQKKSEKELYRLARQRDEKIRNTEKVCATCTEYV